MASKTDVLLFGLVAIGLGVAGYAGYKAIGWLGSSFKLGGLAGSEGVDLLRNKTQLDIMGNIPKATQEANLKTAVDNDAEAYKATQDDYLNHLEWLNQHPESKELYDIYLRERQEGISAGAYYKQNVAWDWWSGQETKNSKANYQTYLKELKESQDAYQALMVSIKQAGG